MTQPGLPKGGANKVIVGGVLERGGKVRTVIVEDRSRKPLQALVTDNVEYGSYLSTDDCHSYWGLDKEYVRQIVDHAERYVDGQIHTNGLENFWSLVKRGLKGTRKAPDSLVFLGLYFRSFSRFHSLCLLSISFLGTDKRRFVKLEKLSNSVLCLLVIASAPSV